MLNTGQIRTRLRAGSIRGAEFDTLWFFAPLSLAAAVVLLALAFAPSAALASGDANEVSCPNEGNTGFSSALPDCRAYEQVTPVFKNSFKPAYQTLLAGGERVRWESFSALAGATVAANCGENQYESARTPEGWKTTALNDASLGEFAYATHACTPIAANDAGEALLQLHPVTRSVYERDLYIHNAEGKFVLVGPMLPRSAVPATPTGGGPQGATSGVLFVGGTPDFSHILFSLTALNNPLPPGVTTQLWPGDTTLLGPEVVSRSSLYEYVGVDNVTPSLVGVDNTGTLISDCSTIPGGPPLNEGSRLNVMSEDGSRVFFTALGRGFPEDKRCTGAPVMPRVDELFAHVHGGAPQSPIDSQQGCTITADACTVAISEPQALSPVAPDAGCTSEECLKDVSEPANFRDANFEKASRDGSRVFFTSPQKLLDGATQDGDEEDGAVPSENEKGCASTVGANGCNLYEFDFNEPEGHRLVLVSSGDSSGLGPEVQGVAAVSEDGSHVYFVARGKLTNEPRGGEEGICISALDSAELAEELATREGNCRPKRNSENLYVWDAATGKTAFVATLESSDARQWSPGTPEPMGATDDGRFLVFTSVRKLTPRDASHVQQVYRYDSSNGELAKVSIGGEGSSSATGAEILRQSSTTQTIATNLDSHPAVSETGVVVFFSSEALLPGATDTECLTEEEGECRAFAENIYEYNEGRVYLISAGTEAGGTISQSGRDIFFDVRGSLASSDGDTLSDIYDARVVGGFPGPLAPAPCEGEECQGSGTSPVTFGPPASAILSSNKNFPVSQSVPVKKAAILAKCRRGADLHHRKCPKRMHRRKAKIRNARSRGRSGRS